jgi:hypothetical protein
MDAAAHEQVADHRARGLVRGHFVDARLVRARSAFQEEIVQKIEDEVARVEDEIAVPGRPMRVRDRVARAAHDEVVREAHVLHVLEGRIARIVVGGRLIEKRVDGRGDEFHVAHLLGRDRGHELVEGTQFRFGLHGRGLMKIVHQCRHFTEASAEQLLHGRRRIRVGFGRSGEFDLQSVYAQEHDASSSWIRKRRRNTRCTPSSRHSPARMPLARRRGAPGLIPERRQEAGPVRTGSDCRSRRSVHGVREPDNTTDAELDLETTRALPWHARERRRRAIACGPPPPHAFAARPGSRN